MKKRILAYGISATHQMITKLSSIDEPVSISDFDAFVFNPEYQYLEAPSLAGINRRKNEINDLLGKKGGLARISHQTSRIEDGKGRFGVERVN
ncbi:MAG: hypothetical protein ACHP8A_18245 [Terriglobales bacterium]